MRGIIRLTSVLVASFVLNFYVTSCFAAGEAAPLPGQVKVTTNDPQFIPLSEEQTITKGVPWYVYVIGVAVIAGAAAAAGGGGGGGGTTTTAPSTGTVTGTW
jgi:hypothetical protein